MQLWNVGTETPSGRLSRGKKNWQPRYCHEPWQRESMSTNPFHFYFPAMPLGQPVAFSVPRVIRMAGTQRKSDLALFHRKGVHRNCRILFEQSTRDFDTARFSFSYASTH